MNAIQLSVALHTPTLWTGVFIPLLLTIGVFIWSPKVARLHFGIALALLPLSWFATWFDAGGLHSVPVHFLGALYLATRGRIDIKDAAPMWAAFYFVCLLNDGGHAYFEYASELSMWYGGIGGDGLTDGLVTLPILMTAFILQIGRMAQGGWKMTVAPVAVNP